MFKLLLRRRLLMSSALVCLPCILSPDILHAQTVPEVAPKMVAPPSTEAKVKKANKVNAPAGLEQITVTAQKHTGTIQKTPIAISVYSGNTIKQQGIHDMASLATIAPAVNYTQAAAGLPVITIRGISSNDVSEVGDPAVAVSRDGVYLNRSYTLNSTFYDLDRIEVLNGPQGTLSGRNAVGGAINIITAKPTKKLEGYLSANYGNYDTFNVEAMLNVPISDKVQVRAAFTSRSHSGYRYTPPGGRGDDEDAKSGRFEIAFQPFENFDGVVTYEGTHLGGYGGAQKLVPLQYDASGSVIHGMPDIGNVSHFTSMVQPKLDVMENSLRTQFNLHLPGIHSVITYVGGYDVTNFGQVSNNGALYPRSFVQNEKPKTQNNELRIGSEGQHRLTWVAGVYYFREDNSIYSYVLQPATYSPAVRGTTYDYLTTALSVAGFGQVGYKILPNLTVSGGVRYNYDQKQRTGNSYFANVTNNPPTYSGSSANGNASWTKPTFHAGLEWQMTPRILGYVKFDSGYKPGGFTTVNSYGPETVKAYEMGLKSRFFDNRLQFNFAGFYEDYTGQQVSQYVQQNGATVQAIVNAGHSQIYGIEPDMVLLLPVLGRLDLSMQWLHARFVQFNYLGTKYAGNMLPQAPNFSVGAGFSHEWAIPTGTLTTQIRTKFQSAQYMLFNNYGDNRQGAYTTTNFNVIYEPRHQPWKIEGYVRNLENSQVITEAFEDQYASAYRFAFAAPRTYGLQVSARF